MLTILMQGGNLNAASRQALMQKLARIDQAPARPQPMLVPSLLGSYFTSNVDAFAA